MTSKPYYLQPLLRRQHGDKAKEALRWALREQHQVREAGRHQRPKDGLRRHSGRVGAAAYRDQGTSPQRGSSTGLLGNSQEWLEEWRSTFLRASDRAHATKTLYARLTVIWVEPTIGTIRLDRLRPSDITRMLLAMEDEGLAGSTRRSAYAALRGALEDAVNNELLKDNPASA